MSTEEKGQIKRILITVAAVAAVLCAILTVFFRTSVITGFIGKALSILEPFLWGFAIAYLLHPISAFFENLLKKLEERVSKKKRPGLIRLCSIVFALLFLFTAVVLLLQMLLPELVASISSLISQLPGTISRFQEWIASLDHGSNSHEAVVAVQEVVDTLSERLQNFLQTDLLPNLQTFVSSVTGSFMSILDVLKNFGLGCIIAAYILGSWEQFISQLGMIVYALFPKRTADWIRDEAAFTDRMFSGFIHGKVLDSLIIGVICLIFTLAVRMPYAVLISVIVGVTNIIPFFGPYIGAIPSALLVLTVSPVKCIVFVVFIIVLQQLDGNYIGPRILGDRLGISGIWILFSIMVFSSLLGFVGMLVGVPVFAVIYDLIRRGIYRLLNMRGEEKRIAVYETTYHPGEKDGKKQK